MKRLVLFDIDGTIMNCRIGSVCNVSLKRYFNLDIPSKAVYCNGLTDRASLVKKLESVGVKNSENDPRLDKALDDFGPIAEELIKKGTIELVNNIENVIESMNNEDFTLGLLTGNTKDEAYAKLKHVKLNKHFHIGAFGKDTMIRSELVPFAINDAKEKTGIEFTKDQIFLIGDTERDIDGAKQSGVRCIAVATGEVPFEILEKHEPDFLINDFNDIDGLINYIKNNKNIKNNKVE